MTHATTQQPSQFIDAHCHLADPRLERRVETFIDRAEAVGVTQFLQGGVDPDDWGRQLALQARFGKRILPVFGLHPWWVCDASDSDLDAGLLKLEDALNGASAPMALGETGLDAVRGRDEGLPGERQRRAFLAQLGLARRFSKPLVLHIVRAHEEALQTLEAHAPFPCGGLVHSFGASAEQARRYLALGLLLSFGGGITRGGFQKTQKALLSVPLEKLVLETDAPDQTPSLPGLSPEAENEPAHLVAIADYAASLRGEDGRALLTQSAQNLRRLLEIA